MEQRNVDTLIKKFSNAFKFSGFLIRRDLCKLIVEELIKDHVSLNVPSTFDRYFKSLCGSLEKQNLSERSIEKEHVEEAIEDCLHCGGDKHETIFNLINAFDFPRLRYNPDRKLYFIEPNNANLLADASSKTQLFNDRYNAVLQRTKRNFKNKLSPANMLKLETIDYLLTTSSITLDRTLVLGSLLQISEGKYCLEDPTGMVALDLTNTKYHEGFFVESVFVLVNGVYEDDVLTVSTIILPPGEEYRDSKQVFGSLNYFGGPSLTCLRESQKLKMQLGNDSRSILIFSDLWLDNDLIFEKLQMLFDGIKSCPPIAFIFIGNFMEELHGLEKMNNLRELFKQLGELIASYPTITTNSEFVFLPGLSDPAIPHILPKHQLPSYISEVFSKFVPRVRFATNPCRIQFCTKEIAVVKANILAKLMQGSLHKPNKDDISESITRTIISQGHLCPLSINALPVHWDFDYTLHLYPLPDLVIIGDKSDMYQGEYKGCQIVNPGAFCENGFQFKSYTPQSNTIDDCIL